MHTRLTSALACAALLAAMAAQTTVHASTERPRDSGVGCARADNRYCKVPHDAVAGDARSASRGSESFPSAAGR